MNARAINRVSTNAGSRLSRSGRLERLEIGDVALDRVLVTLLSESGLETKADGLLPGTLFDAIYFDHDNDFVIFNPGRVSRREEPNAEGRGSRNLSRGHRSDVLNIVDLHNVQR